MQCSTTAQCYNAYCVPSLTPIPNCSSVCINGHCYTTHPGTNPTITDVACRSSNDYGSWSSCMSGQDTCGACAAQGYTCQVRYCINPPNSNQYQISCGCIQPSSPPGTGGSTCQNLYYCRLSDLLVPSTSSTYDPQSHLQCPNGDLCESNLKTYLPGQTTETCYNSPTYAQGYCCKPLYYCNTTTGCQQTSSSYDSSHFQCTATGGRLSNTCEANLQTYLPGQTTNICYLNLNQCQQACITNTPTPTATPTPNPHWVKLKNTSFYTPRSLVQSIPASPVAVTTQPCHCEPPQAAKQSPIYQAKLTRLEIASSQRTLLAMTSTTVLRQG